MENLQEAKRKSMDTMTLQEYADAYCESNRFLAIYELMSCGKENNMDRHLADLSQKEAAFAVYLLEDYAAKYVRGAKRYHQATRLAASFGMDLKDIRRNTPNPATKKLLSTAIGMFATIVLLLVIGLTIQPMDFLLEVSIGLFAVTIAGHVTTFFRFRKLKRLAKCLPDMEALEHMQTPFEELFAAFNRHYRPKKK